MKKIFGTLALLLTVLAICFAPVRCLAQEMENDPEHDKAVIELLTTLRVPDRMRFAFDLLSKEQSESKALYAHVATRTSDADIARMHLPVYIPLVTTKEAVAMTAAFRTDAGQAFLLRELDYVRVGGTPALPRDNAGMKKFLTAGWGKKYRDLMQRATRVGVQPVIEQLSEYHLGLFVDGLNEITAHLDAQTGADAKTPPTTLVPSLTGISYIDAMLLLTADWALKNAKAQWKLSEELPALGADWLVAPETLVTPKKLTAARAALPAYVARIERYVSEMDALTNDYEAKIKAVQAPRKEDFQEVYQISIDAQREWNTSTAKNQRALFDVMRRIVEFADARKGKIGILKGGIYFSDAADLATYNVLVAETVRLFEEQVAKPKE
ncbi:MAG: hypothetical protein V4633_25070 [Pseudomonadota bacterium]